MTDVHERRLADVRGAMADKDLDALLVDEAGNRRWLTGFTGSAGVVIVTPTSAHLLTDSRYFEQVGQQAPAFELVRASGAPTKELCQLLEAVDARHVGFEADVVTVARMRRLEKEAEAIEWVPTSGVVAAFRAVKTEEEIEQIARCAALADRAMELAYETARPGMTEKELAWTLERFMRENGAEGLAFPIIVGSGPNSALPHHATGERVIQAGEAIVIDLGPTIDGYNGDLTRTFSIGPATDPDFDTVYKVVDEANRAAADGIRPGVSGPEADAFARDHIVQAGYGEAFGHGLGHGVGLNVHEMPRLGAAAGDEPLRAGMVVTIEPGIYLPGRFGVRIEDLTVVREEGIETLSKVEKRPRIGT